jgi:hypothetical protein
MSGGSMDFLYSRILNAEFELNTPERIAFKQHLNLVAEACKAIEWVDSGDNSEGSENEFISACLLNKDGLINLLTSLYTDAQMALDGTWDSTYDKNGFRDQQHLIEQFCKANNIELAISQKTKYAIQVITVMFGQETSREFYTDDNTNEVLLFDNKFVAERIANKMCDEFVYTEVVEYDK